MAIKNLLVAILCVTLGTGTAGAEPGHGSTATYDSVARKILTGEASLSSSGSFMLYATVTSGRRETIVKGIGASTATSVYSLDELLAQPTAFSFWVLSKESLVAMTTPASGPPNFFVVDPVSRKYERVASSEGKVPVYIHNTPVNGFAAPIIVLGRPTATGLQEICQITQSQGACEPIEGTFPKLRLKEFGGRPTSLELSLTSGGERWSFAEVPLVAPRSAGASKSAFYGNVELVSTDESSQTVTVRAVGASGHLELVRLSTRLPPKVLGQSDDVVFALISPSSGQVQAYVSEGHLPRWTVLDRQLTSTFAALNRRKGAFPWVVGRSKDDNRWLVRYESQDQPYEFAVFDRALRKLETVKLVERADHPSGIQTIISGQALGKDGSSVPVYLTQPSRKCPNDGCPLVVEIHGGPYARDRGFYTPERSWWASKGYAVLSVNFRGSSGYGLSHERAIVKEWGGNAVRDVAAAIRWARATGKFVSATKLALVGESYGAYSALALAVQEPDLPQCVVAKSGVADLGAYVDYALQKRQERATSMREDVGDPKNADDHARLDEQSVLRLHQSLRAQTLLVHGRNDEITPIENIQELVYQLRPRRHKFSYIVFPLEGHRFSYASQVAFRELAGEFVANCLGMVPQPSSASIPDGVTLNIRDGAHLFPSLISKCGPARRDAFGLSEDSSCAFEVDSQKPTYFDDHPELSTWGSNSLGPVTQR